MRCDVVVVGAGPAGLSAAVAAAPHRSVVVVDLAARPGGQFYRRPPGAPPIRLAAQAAALGVTMLSGRRVFLVEPGFTVHTDTEPVTADTVVIATGAHDRPVPFPGWDLPGVLTAGGAQALLKGNRVLPGRRIVVAGTGPFLLPVGAGLASAGADVAGVFEANSPAGFARHPGVVARHPDKLVEAARHLAVLARHRVPVRHRHAVQAAHGTDQVTAVTVAKVDRDWRPVTGTERRIDCDTVAVGCGFVPQIDTGTALGCATDLMAGTPALRVDDRQATTVPGVFAAGEVTGIGGVRLSLSEGRIAGLAASGVDTPAALLRRRNADRAFAVALADVYPVRPGWLASLTGDTLLCRCEEVDHGTVRAAVTELGARDARAVKLLTRAGMGWCQGRMCGDAVACVVADLTGGTADPTDLNRRILAQPVRLRDLANDNVEDR
ncbi:MAG TPA: FAD-dependent oxidoreductase [Pseudonocardiaceae bacterium]|nr:FAD-dependent oxidoreductase [Pseudonocardiaceae bacterium]